MAKASQEEGDPDSGARAGGRGEPRSGAELRDPFHLQEGEAQVIAVLQLHELINSLDAVTFILFACHHSTYTVQP